MGVVNGNCKVGLLDMVDSEIMYGYDILRSLSFCSPDGLLNRLLHRKDYRDFKKDTVSGYGVVMSEPICSEGKNFLTTWVAVYCGLERKGSRVVFRNLHKSQNGEDKKYCILMKLHIPKYVGFVSLGSTIFFTGFCENVITTTENNNVYSVIPKDSSFEYVSKQAYLNVYASCIHKVDLSNENLYGERDNETFKSDFKYFYKSLGRNIEREQLCVALKVERTVVSEGDLYFYFTVSNGLNNAVYIKEVSIKPEKDCPLNYIDKEHIDFTDNENLKEYYGKNLTGVVNGEEFSGILKCSNLKNVYKELSYNISKGISHINDEVVKVGLDGGVVQKYSTKMFCIKIPCTVFPKFELSFNIDTNEDFIPLRPFVFDINFLDYTKNSI